MIYNYFFLISHKNLIKYLSLRYFHLHSLNYSSRSTDWYLPKKSFIHSFLNRLRVHTFSSEFNISAPLLVCFFVLKPRGSFVCSLLLWINQMALRLPLPFRRFVRNESLFTELVEASRDLPGNRWAVGGNAPVMASRMATEGCDVLLGGSFSPDFTDVLSQHITGTQTLVFWRSSPGSFHFARIFFPPLYCVWPTSVCLRLVAGEEVEEPDIHLILEYPSGASWGQYSSRRANRYAAVNEIHTYIDIYSMSSVRDKYIFRRLFHCFSSAFKCRFLSFSLFSRYIIHSDDHNPYLTSMEEFAAKLGGFSPDLVVVGGLQMMDNFPFQSGMGVVDLKSFCTGT